MAQFFQIEGTQQVFMLQGNDRIGLQFAAQDSCAANQTNTTVLQHPQGVLLTDAIVSSPNNSTIELVRYTNSQPPALYYHTTQQVVESHQSEDAGSQGAQQATIQIQQFPQLRGTLIGNQVVHNHITNETYEVTVEETEEQLDGGELLFEGEITEEEVGLEPACTQTDSLSTNKFNNESNESQCIEQNSLPCQNDQIASGMDEAQPVQPEMVQVQPVQQRVVQTQPVHQQVVQSQPVHQQMVQPQAVQQQMVQPQAVQQQMVQPQAVQQQMVQPQVVQQQMVQPQAVQQQMVQPQAVQQQMVQPQVVQQQMVQPQPVQQQISQHEAVYNQAVQQRVIQTIVSQPCVVQQIPVVQRTIPVHQQHLVTSDGLQVSASNHSALTQSYIVGNQSSPQTLRSVFIQQPHQTEKVLQGKHAQVIQVKQSQGLQQSRQQPQAMQQVRQHQVIQTLKPQPQIIQSLKQPSQLIQSVKQSSQLMQTMNQSSQLIQSVKQPSQLMQTMNQSSQLIQAVKQPSQLMQTMNQPSQLIQSVKQPSQLMQTMNQPSQSIHTVKQPSQIIQTVKQPAQIVQSVKTQSQIIQMAKAQPQLIQTVKAHSQVIQTVKQQPQVMQSVKQPTEVNVKSETNVDEETATSVHTIAGIKVTAYTPTGKVNVQKTPVYKNEAKKRKAPNITRRSLPAVSSKVNQMLLNNSNLRVNAETAYALQTLARDNIDVPLSKYVNEVTQSVKGDCLSDSSLQEQSTPLSSRTLITSKGQRIPQYQQSGEVEAQSPHERLVTLQESPQTLQNQVVQLRLDASNTLSSLSPQMKSLLLHETPTKRVQTYPSAKNRLITKSVTKEVTSPASPQQHIHQRLVIHRDPQTQKLNSGVVGRKDQVVLVMPQNRQLIQSNANLRVAAGNKVLTIDEVQRAMRDGGSIRVSPALTLASGSNVVVIKPDNALLPEEVKHSLTSADGQVVAEKVKIIPGKLAVCLHCGFSSTDFNRCSRCKRKFPPNCKVVETQDAFSEVLEQSKKAIFVDQEKLRKSNTKVVSLSVNAADKKKPRAPVRRVKPIPDVPECLTLSSDEEDSTVDHEDNFLDNSCGELEEEEMETNDSADESRGDSGIEGGGLLQQASDGSLAGPLIQLICRSVRIGSYKVKPLQRVLLAEPGLEIVVPTPNKDDEGIKIFINMQDIRRILLCSDRTMPALFIYVRSPAAARIRELLNMTDPTSDFYFHPDSKEEIYKRITLLPEKYNDEYKMNIRKTVPSTLLMDIPYLKANDILLKSCPKEMQAQIRKNTSSVSKIQTILVYPPPPAKGGISINTEDYACLGEDVFLNDVIIDFYLKYLMLAVLSPEDRERTHVFSTFFYKRLTSPPGKSMRASHPVESNPNLSPAEKRHSRVKSWTKNINLFTKDFVIIPINEKCHWFLAIICFPGQDGCLRMSDNVPLSPPLTPTKSAAAAAAAAAAAEAAATAAAVAAASGSSKIKVNSNNVLSIGSTTITPVKPTSDTITLDCNNGEEGSDRDEAEGDEEEMDEPTSEDEESPAASATEEGTADIPAVENPPKTEVAEEVPKVDEKPKSNRPKFSRDAIKQPCILIFDSLMGAPRSRVVATLRDYLRIEHKVKEGREKDFNKDTIKGMMPKVPQQKNFTDCGLYLLQYVEQFFKDPIKDYHPPIKTLKDWFPADVVRRKRQEIQELLHQLMADQKIDVSKLNLPHLTFSSQRKPEEAEGSSAPCESGEAPSSEAGEGDAENTAQVVAQAAAQAAADEAAAELVWGAAGAEEEVTTDGVAPLEDVPCEYNQMDAEEELEEEEAPEELNEEGMRAYEEDEHIEHCEELEEGEEEIEEPEEGVCQVMDGAVLKMPRLVNYPDSEEWSPSDSPAHSPISLPAGITLTPTSDSLKRTYTLSVRRASEIKRRKLSDR